MHQFVKINSAIIVMFIILFFACNSNKKVNSLSGKNIQLEIPELIKTYFTEKDSLQITPNKSNTYVLYLSESLVSPASPTSNSKFIIFDCTLNKIILQENYSNSLIKWYDNDNLLLTRFFGIIETPLSSSIKYYLINIYTKEINEINSEIINQQL